MDTTCCKNKKDPLNGCLYIELKQILKVNVLSEKGRLYIPLDRKTCCKYICAEYSTASVDPEIPEVGNSSRDEKHR